MAGLDVPTSCNCLGLPVLPSLPEVDAAELSSGKKGWITRGGSRATWDNVEAEDPGKDRSWMVFSGQGKKYKPLHDVRNMFGITNLCTYPNQGRTHYSSMRAEGSAHDVSLANFPEFQESIQMH